MNKRKLYKELSAHFKVEKRLHSSGDFVVVVEDKEIVIKMIKVPRNAQVTFNSKRIVEVASGYLNGIRYMKKNVSLIDLDDLYESRDVVLLFSMKPFRVLKYLNESDIEDVSDKNQIHGYNVFYDMSMVVNYLERL
jgi:DNA helicase TIP49 (TBP-interacting protein)